MIIIFLFTDMLKYGHNFWRQCDCWDDFENGKCQGNTANFFLPSIEISSPNIKGMYYAKADQNGLGLHPDAHQEQFDYPYDATCGKQMLLIFFDKKPSATFHLGMEQKNPKVSRTSSSPPTVLMVRPAKFTFWLTLFSCLKFLLARSRS